MTRPLLSVIGAFIATAVLAYLVVFFGTVAFWQLTGATDRDGGHGMGLAFGVAPLVALLAGTVGAIVAGARVRRRAQGVAAGAPADAHARRASPVAGAMVGALAGFLPARLAIWLVLGRGEYDALWKALAHAWSPVLLGLVGAGVGWRLFGGTRRQV